MNIKTLRDLIKNWCFFNDIEATQEQREALVKAIKVVSIDTSKEDNREIGVGC